MTTGNTMRKAMRTIRILLCAFIASAAPAAMAAQPPRLVISDLKVPTQLSAQERALLRQLPLVEVISESLTDSRSFRVQVRDDAGVQAILRELQIQKSSVAREGKAKPMGLDAPDYILEPTVTRLRSTTRFEKLELLAGMYTRIDAGDLEMQVRIYDMGGNVVFEETASAIAQYAKQEATEEQKRRGAAPSPAPMLRASRTASGAIVNAIVARINPITVLEVQDKVFIIDRGRNNGFDDKTAFVVYSQPRTIKNPNTGADHTVPGKRIGEARVVAMHEEVSELQFIDADGAQVATAGAIVRIKEAK
jgi:hypothetical protein